MSSTSAKTVAEWMVSQIAEKGELYQEDAAYHIQQHFGNDFVYINDNGNLAIAKPVLAEFRKLTPADVVWVRSERYWRRRESFDESGKRAAE